MSFEKFGRSREHTAATPMIRVPFSFTTHDNIDFEGPKISYVDGPTKISFYMIN